MSAVIELKDVVVDYRRKRALNGLSFEVKKGEIFGFLGPNGSGKTTTIKAILGLLQIRSGSIAVNGRTPHDSAARAKIGFLPEETTYYRFLTPFELLNFYGEVFGLPRPERRLRAEKLLERVGVQEYLHKPIRTLSKGTVQKVSLAQALVNEPDMLVLDEPTAGLDPLARMDLRTLLGDLKKEGRTVFFSSHELSEVELVCDSFAILKAGQIIEGGSLKRFVETSGGESLERFFIRTIGNIKEVAG